MRKIFYSFLPLFTAITVFAQAPGGISGSVLWLKGNSGASASAWTDNSGNLNDFLQGTALNQPVLANNVFNFNAALQFNGTAYMTKLFPNAFPETNNARTIFVVANATATDNYRWIFVYGSPGSIGATCQFGNFNTGVANAFYGIDLTTNNYWNAPANTNGALSAFTLNSGTGNQFDRGNLINSGSLTGLTATSVHGIIGALDESGSQPWSGSIGEVIMFNTALSNAQRNQVEAYLALKYGFTLGTIATPINYVASDGTTTYWTGSATYQNDVFGIGTDNGTSLIQTQSNSMNAGNGDGTGQNVKGNLILSAGTALTDKQFLMIGNDAGALTEHLIVGGEAPAIAVGSDRVVRNWKAQNTGIAGPVNLSFDITGLTLTGGMTAANYRLMIDQDGDGIYTTGTQTFVKPTSFTGNQLNFTGVTLANNVVFTVITQASALLPAIWQGFTVTLQKDKATLVWKTSDEINVDHYTAEYSTDGNSFQPIGSVAAKNGAGTNTYSLVQENLPAGPRYYHIKRFDKDGQAQVSDVKSIRVNGVNSMLLISANPVTKTKLEMNIDVQQSQDAIIRIINTNGKILVQQHAGLSAGANSVSTNIAGLATGAYFLQVQLGTQIINKKFVRL